MHELLSRLPPHERRRLEAVPNRDVHDLARRRLAGEPLQYLEGSAPFVDFDVMVDERVLIPRPETEGLYELVAGRVHHPEVIVDLGTGSGVLAIALQRAFPRAEVHAVDTSPQALDVARANAARLAGDLRFHQGDLYSALPPAVAGRVDVLVSNPPYVAEGEWPHLPVDVRKEPRRALVAGIRGTEVLERIAAGAGGWMAPGGLIAVEIGETQARVVRATFAPLGRVEISSDLAGRPRYAVVEVAP